MTDTRALMARRARRHIEQPALTRRDRLDRWLRRHPGGALALLVAAQVAVTSAVLALVGWWV